MFEKAEDYNAFLRVLDQTWSVVPLPIFAMCVMPNHWHFVVRPEEDDQVTEFFYRLSLTHAARWHTHQDTTGTGHVYQGRFKSFPIQDDEHLLTVMRYVERNPVRAKLVERAEDWPWGSAWTRERQDPESHPWLASPTGGPLPEDWKAWVNQPLMASEIEALCRCVRRGTPFGCEAWVRKSVERLGLQSTVRGRGRPQKEA